MSQPRTTLVTAGLLALGLLVAAAAGVAVASVVTERAVADAFGAAPTLPTVEIEGATPDGCTRGRDAACPGQRRAESARALQAAVERAADAGCPWARAHRDVDWAPAAPVAPQRPVAADLIAVLR